MDDERENIDYKRKVGDWKTWRYKNKFRRKRMIKGKTKTWKREDIYDENAEEAEPEGPKRKVKKLQTVIFTQHTEHSELAHRIRRKLNELEKVGQIKVKVVERSGTKLEELLHKSNAWENKDCLRENCWICSESNLGGKKGQCYKKNITYETYCITCYKNTKKEKLKEKEVEEREKESFGAEPSSQYSIKGVVKEKRIGKEGESIGAVPSSQYGIKGVVKEIKSIGKESGEKELKRKERIEFKVKYVGESSRSLFERSNEHREDFLNLSEKSHMLKHYLTHHKDIKREELEFGIRVRKKFKKSFGRQVGEAIVIEQEILSGTILLNSKSEFNRCSVARLTIGTYKDNVEEMKKEEKEKNLLKEEIEKPEDEGDLEKICDDILKENYLQWKKRRIQEEIIKEKIERKEEADWERTKRLNKARWKKKDLLEQIEKKKREGEPIQWITKKQEYWRKYRERIELKEAEAEEVRRKIIELMPERKKKVDVDKRVVETDMIESEKVESGDVVDRSENAAVTVDFDGESEVIRKRGRVKKKLRMIEVMREEERKRIVRDKVEKDIENKTTSKLSFMSTKTTTTPPVLDLPSARSQSALSSSNSSLLVSIQLTDPKILLSSSLLPSKSSHQSYNSSRSLSTPPDASKMVSSNKIKIKSSSPSNPVATSSKSFRAIPPPYSTANLTSESPEKPHYSDYMMDSDDRQPLKDQHCMNTLQENITFSSFIANTTSRNAPRMSLKSSVISSSPGPMPSLIQSTNNSSLATAEEHVTSVSSSPSSKPGIEPPISQGSQVPLSLSPSLFILSSKPENMSQLLQENKENVFSMGHPDHININDRIDGNQSKVGASRGDIENLVNLNENENIAMCSYTPGQITCTKRHLCADTITNQVVTSQEQNYRDNSGQNTDKNHENESPKMPKDLQKMSNFEKIRLKFEDKKKRNESEVRERSCMSPGLLKLMQRNEKRLSENLKTKREEKSAKKIKKMEKEAKMKSQNMERLKFRDIQKMFDKMSKKCATEPVESVPINDVIKCEIQNVDRDKISIFMPVKSIEKSAKKIIKHREIWSDSPAGGSSRGSILDLPIGVNVNTENYTQNRQLVRQESSSFARYSSKSLMDTKISSQKKDNRGSPSTSSHIIP